jgi:hypothetical protein
MGESKSAKRVAEKIRLKAAIRLNNIPVAVFYCIGNYIIGPQISTEKNCKNFKQFRVVL